jgi:hypothetical protein
MAAGLLAGAPDRVKEAPLPAQVRHHGPVQQGHETRSPSGPHPNRALGSEKTASHPAPPPGGAAPVWINAAQPAPAGLAVPTAGDLARLAVRRLYERLEAGAAVSPADAVALLRLARETERDGASSARPDPRWQASMAEVLWLCGRSPNSPGAVIK